MQDGHYKPRGELLCLSEETQTTEEAAGKTGGQEGLESGRESTTMKPKPSCDPYGFWLSKL